MVRVLRFLPLITVCAISATVFADESPSRHSISVGVDLGYVDVSGYESWTEGSVGKLRHDSDGVKLSRAFLDYNVRLTDTLNATAVLQAYDDNLGTEIDFTEAYLEWRPVPRSPNRYRLKVGAFYPRISLENVDPGWSNAYTLSSSAINTWVAEELRSVGAELSLSRRPQSLGGMHEFSVTAAVFMGSDPAGSLLAWKGWSVHDRQTRYSDKLPLPPLPQIQTGMMFAAQDPYVEPLREIDDRPGYYFSGEWRYGERFLVRAMHYDNKAEPTALVSGQYGWRTPFDSLGALVTLPGDVGVLAQWMSGSTVMGPVMNGAHVVDVEYDAYYLLVSKVFGKHRIAARYDNFGMTQNDEIPEDDNSESGLAWTMSYRYDLSDNFDIAAEWLSIKTHRCAYDYHDLEETVTERQLQLMLQVRF